MAFTSRLTQGEAPSNHVSVRSESVPSRRSRPLRALFVHRDRDAIDACVQELEKAQFTVSSDCVLNLSQCAEQLQSKSYDVIIAEYLGSQCSGPQGLQLLHQILQEIAVIFLPPEFEAESMLELRAKVFLDCFRREIMAPFPLVFV